MPHRNEIPVVHCFDARYVAPAAVSFLSMLENASRYSFYRLYVLHPGIPDADIAALTEIVRRFDNASIEFRRLESEYKLLDRLWDKLPDKGRRHYSREMFLKLAMPSLFPEYDKIVVTDVDVVWKGDVASCFDEFGDGGEYVAGINSSLLSCEWAKSQEHLSLSTFSDEERTKIRSGIGAGYMFMDLAAMRRDGVQDRLFDFVQKNIERLRNPEQDAFNIVCAGKIRILPNRMMVCSYLYDKTTDAERALNAPRIENPVQVHYASQEKPWNTPSSAMSEEWFRVLTYTPYFKSVMRPFDPPAKREKKWLSLCGVPMVRIKQKPMRPAEYALFGCLPLSLEGGREK